MTRAADEFVVRVEANGKSSTTSVEENEVSDSGRPALLALSAKDIPEKGVHQPPLQRDFADCGSKEPEGGAGKIQMSGMEVSKQERHSNVRISDLMAADEARQDSLGRMINRQEKPSNNYSNTAVPLEIMKNRPFEKLRTTKSRFAEPTIVLRPDKEAVQHGTPARQLTRKAELVEDDEEDPFKDIDFGDKFRQGKVAWTQWAALIVILSCLVCSLTLARLDKRQIWGLELWKWFLFVLVVFCGRLVSGWLIRLVVILFERNFLLRKKVLYFVYGLRKGVQNCLWLGLVLLSWRLIFDRRGHNRSRRSQKILSLVTKLMECLLFGAVAWLLKILLVKALASSFHVSTFFDRIQESLLNQHVLEVLSCPPFYESLNAEERHKQQIKAQALQKLSGKDVSAGHMKTLMNLVRHPGLGKLVNTIDEAVSFQDDNDDKQGLEINSERQAKGAAKEIFKNVAQPSVSYIVEEDLLAFMHKEDAAKVFSSFEGATESKKITKKALKNWVVNVYKERKALAHSLNDTKTAVDELHRMASVAAGIITIIVALLVLGIASTHVLLFILSQLLLVAFIFSNTLKQVFEAIVFLFVTHPYDVGDRCVIDGTPMVVEEMNILSTIFLKGDSEKVCYPNAVLATKPISNLYRSPEQQEVLDFYVLFTTSNKQIADLKDRITAYVEKKSDHWRPKFGMFVNTIQDLNDLRLTICLNHTINFQNMGDRLNRRSEFLLEMRDVFQELGIEYHRVPQPIHFFKPPSPPSPSPSQQQQQQILPIPLF